MSQLLVCRTYFPAFAVSGSLTVDCAHDDVQLALIVEFLKTVKSLGACVPVKFVCGHESLATLAAVAELRRAVQRYETGDRSEVGEEYVEKYAAERRRAKRIVAKTQEGMGVIAPRPT